MEEGISVLVGGIAIYADLCKRTNLGDFEALNRAIAKSHRTVQKVASDLLDVEDEWNNFLGEVEDKEREHKEKKNGTLIAVGDVIQNNFFLERVTVSSHSALTSADRASNPETLKHILRSSPHSTTLFVFNRHFA